MGLFDFKLNFNDHWRESAQTLVDATEPDTTPLSVAIDLPDAISKILKDRNTKEVYESVLANIAVGWIGRAVAQTVPRAPHPDAERLLERPHPEFSFGNWIRRINKDMYGHGQSFVRMHLDEDGRPEMLEPLNPKKVNLPELVDGIPQFEYLPHEGEGIHIPVMEMLNFRWEQDDENVFKGTGPFDLMGTTLYMDERAIEYTGTVLKNAITGWLVGLDTGKAADIPGTVMTTAQQNATIQKLNDSLADENAGLMQIVPLLISLVRLEPIFKDLDFTRFHYEAETRVCGATGLQPSVLAFGVSSETTRVGAVAYEQRRESWRQGVIPPIHIYESELTYKFLSKFMDDVGGREGNNVSFSRSHINEMRPSPLEAEQLFNGVEKQVFTPNEVREEFGKEDIEGGDQLYEPKPAELSIGLGNGLSVSAEG